jgi:GT2 family glycosyltransferase
VTDLCVSVVVYQPDLPALRATLASLAVALGQARDRGAIGGARVVLVDNGTEDPAGLDALVRHELAGRTWLTVDTVRGHGNVGYGRGHNLAIRNSDAAYHIILNPDVALAPEAIAEALAFLNANPDVGLVAPDVHAADGQRQYLCRQYPSVLVLLLRGFAPPAVRRRFAGYLQAHELRHLLRDTVVKGVPIMSGCCMFARADVLRAVGGFSPSFFLYFEDFDLSLRMGRHAALAFVPAIRIVHAGGGAARKGPRHVTLFLRSAVTFFQTHGWKLV